MKASSAADLGASLRAVHLDLPGDWYRDPWGWPELEFAVNERPDLVLERLDGTFVGTAARMDVPKENYSLRPAVVLDPIDRVAYQALVGRLSVNLIGNLDQSVYGWRLPVKDPRPGIYSPNDKQWDRYRSHLSFIANVNDVALKTDIVSCFASIRFDRLMEAVEARVTRPSNKPVVERLGSYLEAWQRIPLRGGLPQRCQASAVLANMYLSALDDVLFHLAKTWKFLNVSYANFTRWMDDIWVFGSDPGSLRSIQVALNEAMRSLELHMNTGKTKLLEGPDVVAQAIEIEHSAVDDALDSSPSDTGPLDELVEKILRQREESSRTSIRFATERMRRSRHFRKVPNLAANAERLPHAADALARLFRDAGQATGMEDWYLEYCKSPWARVEWPIAQFGTMFPSKGPAGKPLREYFSSTLADGKSGLPLTALAAQRLARWQAREARVVISDAIRRSDSPSHRRVLALAGLAAGCSKTQVSRWLEEFPENRVTLEMLKARSFQKPPQKPDFEA
jgi:hypothetical protein